VTMRDLASGTYRDLTRTVTVACASDGNHGRSVAAGANWFGCGCTVFLHQGVSAGRETAIHALNAQTVRTPGDYDDSVATARSVAAESGWHIVADTSDDPADPMPALVTQGYASLVIELLAQLQGPLPTHVFLQAGVGGLAASVIAQLWETLDPAT